MFGSVAHSSRMPFEWVWPGPFLLKRPKKADSAAEPFYWDLFCHGKFFVKWRGGGGWCLPSIHKAFWAGFHSFRMSLACVWPCRPFSFNALQMLVGVSPYHRGNTSNVFLAWSPFPLTRTSNDLKWVPPLFRMHSKCIRLGQLVL